MKKKRFSLWRYGLAGLFLMGYMVMLGACSFLPGSGSPQEAIVPTDTATPVPTLRNTPTLTLPPTDTLVPTPLMSPTQRATWTPLPTRTYPPTWTPSPTLSPTPTKDIGPILKEDFSDPNASWLQKEGENWATGIARQAYFMTVSQKNVEITSSKSWLKLADVSIRADVYRQTGQGYFGFSCRETVAATYYTIFVTSDGHYGLGLTRNGKVEFIHYAYSEIIPTGREEVFHIRGDCRGDALTLWVNDILLIRKQITGIAPGWVGMMVGMTWNDERPIVVFFDNLEIWGPIE